MTVEMLRETLLSCPCSLCSWLVETPENLQSRMA